MNRPRVFICYARSDGEEFATNLRERLETEQPEITIWQDRSSMEGGVGWSRQITEALDAVEILVLVMTPGALASATTRKEWRYARHQGVRVYPVKAASDEQLDFPSMPKWMSKKHFFDLDHEWDTFVNYLKSPGKEQRVPFMPEDCPEWFVDRPAEFEELRGYLLDEDRQNPVAITTALRGAGGYGKTTLAIALCHDDNVITAFDDGILWVTLGKEANIVDALVQLYAALTDEREGFTREEDAAIAVADKLADRNCLIVIDDVWDAGHLKWFMRGGKGCARLITTRKFDIAGDAQRVDVGEMEPSEAVSMLTAGLDAEPADAKSFEALARRLGEWPLLLELARAHIRKRMDLGNNLQEALKYVNEALTRHGVIAFDQRNASERDQAVAKTMEVSLELLSARELKQYEALAIFPEDVEIPFSAVGGVWGTDDFDTEELAQRQHDLSLLDLNVGTGTIRLHDVVRSYLDGRLSDPVELHKRLVSSWGDLHELSDAYAWKWVAYHLSRAGRGEELRKLLYDFDWMQAKLEATDANALIADYDVLGEDQALSLIQGAIRLSSNALTGDSGQFAGQLLGRLTGEESREIRVILTQAAGSKSGPWTRPLKASLTAPGGPPLRTLEGHTDWISAVAVYDDGRRAVSASDDNTLRVWDLETGHVLATFTGEDWMTACAAPPNGTPIVAGEASGRVHFLRLEGVEGVARP